MFFFSSTLWWIIKEYLDDDRDELSSACVSCARSSDDEWERIFIDILCISPKKHRARALMTFWSDQKKISADIEKTMIIFGRFFLPPAQCSRWARLLFSSQSCVVGVVCELWSASLAKYSRYIEPEKKASRKSLSSVIVRRNIEKYINFPTQPGSRRVVGVRRKQVW